MNLKKIQQYFRSNHEVFLLAVVIVVAAFLRFYRISEYLTFLGDEGRDVLVAKKMVIDGKLTLLGPTASVGGFFLGPLYYYLMAPFLWLWRLDPTGPAVMVALTGVFTVYLLFRFVRQHLSAKAALVTTAIYALSPLVIIHSRSSWNPNVTPFFALILAMAVLGKFGKILDPWRYFLTGLILGLGFQTHYLFLFLFGVVGIFIIIKDLFLAEKITIRNILELVAGLFLATSPIIAFEVRHNYPSTKALIEFLVSGKDTGFIFSEYSATVRDVLFRIFGRLLWNIPSGYDFDKVNLAGRLLWSGAVWLTALGSLGLLLRKVAREKSLKADELRFFTYLLLWLVVPVTLFGFYRREIYDYYFGIVFPVPAILFGVLVDQTPGKTVVFRAAGGILAVILLFLFIWGSPLLKPPNNQLAQVRRIAADAFAKTGSEPFNFALITDGNSDHAYRYFFEIWGKPPVTIENKEVDPERKTVTNQLIVICETINCEPLGNSLWEVAGFGRAEITDRSEVPFVTIYRLVHYEETD
jgi:4-amino-4-deoxy-L-arabinose transferase-like glycosyltransferase